MKRFITAVLFILIAATAATAGGSVIVVTRPASQGERGGDIIRAAASSRSADVVRVFDAISSSGTIGVIHSDTMSPTELAQSLKDDPDVVSVMEDRTIRALKTPSSASEWAQQSNMHAISAPEAWDHTTGSKSISVAVVDSGVNGAHPDLAPNKDSVRGKAVVGGTTDDNNGHGTHVAGIIGATGKNKVAGLNWDVNIIPVRILDKSGYGSISDLIEGLDYLAGLINSDKALKLAAVNLSLGFYSYDAPAEMLSSPFGAALKAFSMIDNAPIVTVAASNEGIEVCAPLLADIYDNGTLIGSVGMYDYPAALSITDIDNLIVVGAVDDRGALSEYSNWGSGAVHITAPGNGVLSTHIPGDATQRKTGTSMAAPHVAGAAALIAAKMETDGKPWDAALLKSRILATADRANIPQIGSGKEPRLQTDRGASINGMLNVYAAVVSNDEEIAAASSVVARTLSVKLVSPLGAAARVGTKYQLVGLPSPSYAATSLAWTSSDPDTASVDTKGILTAKRAGDVKVTCTDATSGLTETINVTVVTSSPVSPSSGGGGGCVAGASFAAVAVMFAIKGKRSAR